MIRRRSPLPGSHRRVRPSVLFLVVAPLVIVTFFSAFVALAGSPDDTPPPATPTPSKPAEPSDSAPATPVEFTDARKSRLANDLRAKPTEQRVELLVELGRYHHPDAMRLILQYGLRDRSPSTQRASAAALAATRGDSSLDDFLLETFRTELKAARRPYPDYVRRLALAVANRRSAVGWNDLAQRALGNDQDESEMCLDALLLGIDDAAADRDLKVVPHLDSLSRTSLFGYSHAFRKCLLDAVCQLDAPAGLSLLVECLARIDGELRADVVDYLRRASGQKLADDPAAWRRWWSQEQGRLLAGRGSPPPALPPRLTADVPRTTNAGAPLYYYDLPVRANRVVFVLDVSKSMGLGGGTSRLAAAQRELAKTLEKLPEGTQFNVIVFEAKVSAMAERLQLATPAMRAHAIQFVRNQRAQGKTATYDALHKALNASPEPEVIYLLSDGMPSAGAVTHPDKVLQSVQLLNRTKRIKVHTLGTLAGRQDAALGEFLQKLSQQNYGEFRSLE